MQGGNSSKEAPAEFRQALQDARDFQTGPECEIAEVPAPQRLAPYAVAFSGEVVRGQEELASGRMVLLFDPQGQPAWDGQWRAVAFAKASLDSELRDEPVLAELGWTWLVETIDAPSLSYTALGGTVTRTDSQSFGALGDTPDQVRLELRASWTPTDPTPGRHVQAWVDLLHTMAAIERLPRGVASLPVE